MSVSEDVARADETSSTPWSELHYDHRSSKVAVDPWDLWRTLRAECPVLFSDRYGGMWFVSRHEDPVDVLVPGHEPHAAVSVTEQHRALGAKRAP